MSDVWTSHRKDPQARKNLHQQSRLPERCEYTCSDHTLGGHGLYFQVQTIPVPVVQVNQQVVDGEDTRDNKGKILESQDPVICDTDNNVLV